MPKIPAGIREINNQNPILPFVIRSPLDAEDSDYLTQQPRPYERSRGHSEKLSSMPPPIRRLGIAPKLLWRVQSYLGYKEVSMMKSKREKKAK